MSLADHVAGLGLVDHHVHGAYLHTAPRDQWEASLNEGSTTPVPDWDDPWDNQLGFAIRARCAPVLGLEPHLSPDEYWAGREALGPMEAARLLTRSAGTEAWLVDTGFTGDACSPDELAQVGGGSAHEIVRLEEVAEVAVAAGGSYADAFRGALAARLENDLAVGTKSVIAYRTGFVVDWSPVSDQEADARAQRWRDAGGRRLADPRLLVFGILAAIDTGLPLQFHVGFGDRDERLDHANPMHLIDLLRAHPLAPIALLHCYPYEREAGYLAQSFGGVHFDVGLSVNYLGAAARGVIARSLELAPFSRVLYSSDAFGPPELHYLGAALWRDATTACLDGFVEAGEWSRRDAERVATLIASGNARRLYRL